MITLRPAVSTWRCLISVMLRSPITRRKTRCPQSTRQVRLAALRGQEIVSVPLQEALQENRKVPPELLAMADSLQEKHGKAVLSNR